MSDITEYFKNLQKALHPRLYLKNKAEAIKEFEEKLDAPPVSEPPKEQPKITPLPNFWESIPSPLLNLPDTIGGVSTRLDSLLARSDLQINLLQQQVSLIDKRLGEIAAHLTLAGHQAENVVTIRDQHQERSYLVKKTFSISLNPTTIGPGVTLTLNLAVPLQGTFAITKVRVDAATNTAGLVRATVLVNGEALFQWPDNTGVPAPIPIFWPRTELDLQAMGGIRVVQNTSTTTIGITFENTSAINQNVTCTALLAWLEETKKEET